MYGAHVPKALMLNEHKNLIVEQIVPQYLLKCSNFTGRLIVLIQARCCPFGWPCDVAAFACQQWVIPELHDVN